MEASELLSWATEKKKVPDRTPGKIKSNSEATLLQRSNCASSFIRTCIDAVDVMLSSDHYSITILGLAYLKSGPGDLIIHRITHRFSSCLQAHVL